MNSRYFVSSVLLISSALVWPSGCNARQDQSEIPATIGEVQDATVRDLQESADAEKATQLESGQLEKMDLATQLRQEQEKFAKQSIDIPKSWKRMGKNHIWADKARKQVIVRGAICMNDGLLEMFACPRDTKEHEAIISVHAKASEIHAVLLAFGVKKGSPMIWHEEYFPVDGPVMNIEIWWTDKNGNLIKRRAQELIRNTDTGKAMSCDFVFGGSEELYDPYTKRNDYMADYGPMINVANQPDAMIDVSIESSAEAQGSLFEAFTENLPPVNTKAYIVISATGKRVEPKAGKHAAVKALEARMEESKADEPKAEENDK